MYANQLKIVRIPSEGHPKSLTICRWMKSFKADPSFVNKNQLNCKYIDVNVSDFLDDMAVQSAIEEIGTLVETDDENVRYEGVHTEKDVDMYLVIEDLANASCERRGKLPFPTDELGYKVIENIRVALINEYDAISSDSESESDD